MESERAEVYERIPWETLETKQNDKKWLVYAVAGAVAVGALAYSYARSQPVTPAPEAASAPVAPISAAPPVTTTPTVTPQPTVASPIVVAEADLYAVDVDAFKRVAATHAEWAAMEYFSSDGITGLLPDDLPAPVVPDGTSVFVDWVGATGVTELNQLEYVVEVVVRSLIADGDGAFVRQPTQQATFEIRIDSDGRPLVVGAPLVGNVATSSLETTGLVEPPAEIRSMVEAEHGPVLGGTQLTDGSWLLVVMKTGVDGIQRPTTVSP